MQVHSSNSRGPGNLLQKTLFRRSLIFGVLIIIALLAFEMFNYSTTDFALANMMGDLRFLGIRWATILAIAFCGIDFAGIARLFTPEKGRDEPAEVWYLFGAWLLGAAMNATLTWWGVSVAIANHETLGNAIVDRATLLKVVPVFVAVMVWLNRVLIIGTFSVAGERLFGVAVAVKEGRSYPQPSYQPSHTYHPAAAPRPVLNKPPGSQPVANFRAVPKTPSEPPSEPIYSRPEPTYHPVSAEPSSSGNLAKRM